MEKIKEKVKQLRQTLENMGYEIGHHIIPDELEELEKLINKPATTTNEQLKKNKKKKCNNLSGLCTCDLGYPCK